jgi:hypothetical protein
MKPLDDFFRDNRELFNADDPPEGHLNRFYNKLDASVGSGKTRTLSMIMKIAAVVVFGLFMSALLYFKGFSLYHSALVKDSCLNTELCEAEDFYAKQVETYYRRIEKMPFTNDPQTRKEILKELREMDTQVVGMKEDLKQNPNDERIIHTIINYYQEKIDMMDMIITRTSVSTNAIL